MIKSLIFDLGNVIVPFDFARGYAEMQKLCTYPAAEIPARIGPDLVIRLESGTITPDAFIAELQTRLGLDVSEAEFRRIWSTIFLPETLIPQSLIACLKGRYPLVLLSNTNAIHWEMLRETYPLLGLFDHHVLSFEIGAMKPSPRIYAEAVRRAGCLPQECFFTDDVPAYVEGAIRAGLDAIQFTGLDRLLVELERRGVSC